MNVAYYNEIDPYAAQWLRNLIAAGHIAPGVVDERSIEDVHPDDLRGFTQCHFFAGIGVWSYTLRLAGWPDDRPVWTGSCPCQPFSAAGKGAGFADERHLWPAFHHLIRECRPAVVFGEQVASRDADPWIDLVCADVEALGYAFGAVPFPSAGVGAPHIRDRLYWVAHTSEQRQHGRRPSSQGDGRNAAWVEPQRLCNADGVADHNQHGCGAQPFGELQHAQHHAEPRGGAGGVGFADEIERGRKPANAAGQLDGPQTGRKQSDCEPSGASVRGIQGQPPTGPTNGIWRDADWLLCRDGKWRPVEPGTFPLAHGAPARVGRLRAYGNAINAEAARAFIEASM